MANTLRFLFGILLVGTSVLRAENETQEPTYKETGFSAITTLGVDLFNALNAKHRNQVNSHPISLETDVMPFVKTVEYPDEAKPLRMIFISAGFIDVINNVAHAKAIDSLEPGYFQKYVVSLSQESGEISLKDLPNLSDGRFWSEDVINEQKSNFNQMVGMVAAIELSHHYLGHFKKYESRLESSGKPVPMNNLLTTSEWEAAMKAGVQNALDAGFGIDGLKAFYDCIDKMPNRPAWTAYFLPNNAKVSKVKKDLEKAERAYFGQ